MAHHLSSHFSAAYMAANDRQGSMSNAHHAQLHAAAIGQAVRTRDDVSPQMEQDIAEHLVDHFASVAQETSQNRIASGLDPDQRTAAAVVMTSEGNQSIRQGSEVS